MTLILSALRPVRVGATDSSAGCGTRDLPGVGDFDPGCFHFLDRVCDVVRLQVNSAAGVFDEVGSESETDCVQRGELHAIVSGQSGHVYVSDPLRFQVIAKPGGVAMAVIEEAAVAVDCWIGSLDEDAVPAALIQILGESSSRGFLDAVDGPKDLREAVEIDAVAWLSSGMIGREAAVIGGVPILSGHDDFETRLEKIHDRDDQIALGNRQRAAGDEVILDIDENESVHGVGPACSSMAQWRPFTGRAPHFRMQNEK
jgi:hypothetical protein